jgi:transposase
VNKHTVEYEVVAIDLAKHVFQVGAEDASGRCVFEHRYRSRGAFHEFIRTLRAPTRVLMETGPGAQAWARELQAQGVTVHLLPAQRVEEHRSGAKNDRNDVLAILRAGRDRTIHPVPVKTVLQLTMQALHRARTGYVRRRTALGNQMRGLLQEHGVIAAQGGHALDRLLLQVLEDASVPIPDRLRMLLAELHAEWKALAGKIDVLSAELGQAAREDPMSRRLMTIPGIGPIIASALVCKEIRSDRFASARQFAAYFGLVPDQHSSGSRIRLGRMSRRGDRYLRSLLIEGAHAVLNQVRTKPPSADVDRLRRWLQRHGRKGAAVRLANRNLRIVWALLQRQGTYLNAATAEATP